MSRGRSSSRAQRESPSGVKEISQAPHGRLGWSWGSEKKLVGAGGTGGEEKDALLKNRLFYEISGKTDLTAINETTLSGSIRRGIVQKGAGTIEKGCLASGSELSVSEET